MALNANQTTQTTAASYIPEKWSAGVNDFFRANLKAAAFFEDWSEDVSDGGDIIHTPNMSQMTANAFAFGSLSEVTLNNQTAGMITLTVNTHYETSFMIGDSVMASFKKSYNMQEKWMKNAAYSTAATLEDAIMALFQDFSTTYGASYMSLYDSSIRAAMSALDVANVPQEDRAFFVYPSVVWNQIMGSDKFGLAVNTAGADPITKGATYMLYGIPIIMSSRIPVGTDVADSKGARCNALAHKSAIAFAVANPAGMSAQAVRVQSEYILARLGTLVTADVIFGVIENRDEAGVLIMTSS